MVSARYVLVVDGDDDDVDNDSDDDEGDGDDYGDDDVFLAGLDTLTE